MTDIKPHVLIALNSRKILNNNISSNEMLHHLQARAKTTDNNKLRQFMTDNATNIMDNNLNSLRQYNMPFYSSRRPNEFTNNVCTPTGCTVSIFDKNGVGQGRMLNH